MIKVKRSNNFQRTKFDYHNLLVSLVSPTVVDKYLKDRNNYFRIMTNELLTFKHYLIIVFVLRVHSTAQF